MSHSRSAGSWGAAGEERSGVAIAMGFTVERVLYQGYNYPEAILYTHYRIAG